MTEIARSRPLVGLLVLVILNLFLLSVQIRSDDGRLLLRTWSLALFSPFALTAHFLSVGAGQLVSRYKFLTALEERNRYLEDQNWRLQIELNRLEAMKRQVEIDNEFDLLRQQYEFQTKRAAIIWRNVPLYSAKIVINAGTRHGVRKDSAVITPSGVVGRVLAVTDFTAEVELLTDVNAAAGAMLGASRLQGVVQGTGEQILDLNYILATEQVDLGETVYTSGKDGIYPVGVPIGAVTEARDEGAVYKRIRVEPYVSYLRLDEVAVVLDEP